MQGNEQHLFQFEKIMENLDEEEKQIVLSKFTVFELLKEIARQDSLKEKKLNVIMDAIRGRENERD